MQLDPTTRGFLEGRRQRQSAWRLVAPFLLLSTIGLAAWLLLRHPLLINPWAVTRGLEEGSIPDTLLLLMAAMLPLAVGTCLVLLLALLAFVHSAMGNERRLIRIIDRLEEKDPGG